MAVTLSMVSGDTKKIAKKFKLKARVDAQRGVTSYMPKNLGSQDKIFIYIVKRDMEDKYFLRLRIVYLTKKLLHLKNYQFTVDGEIHDISVRGPVRQQDLERLNVAGNYYDSEGGGYSEYYDIAMNPREIEILEKIAGAKKVLLKYMGTKGFKNVKIHKGELKNIKRVFGAFAALTAQ